MSRFLWWILNVCDWDHSCKVIFAARKAHAKDILSGDAIKQLLILVLSLSVLIQEWRFGAGINFANILHMKIQRGKVSCVTPLKTNELPVHRPKHLSSWLLWGEPRHWQTKRVSIYLIVSQDSILSSYSEQELQKCDFWRVYLEGTPGQKWLPRPPKKKKKGLRENVSQRCPLVARFPKSNLCFGNCDATC